METVEMTDKDLVEMELDMAVFVNMYGGMSYPDAYREAVEEMKENREFEKAH